MPATYTDNLQTLSIPGFSEPMSCLTHLGGAAVFLALSRPLLRHGRGDSGRMLALGAFAFTSVLLLSISGVYHLLDEESPARDVLRRLDHAAIFALIAGTFTAAHGILFVGFWRWGVVTGAWLIAAAGTVLKCVYLDSVPEMFGTGLYILFGWFGLVTARIVGRQLGFAFVKPLLWGGVAYTCGAVLEFLRHPVLIPGILGPHEMFHVAVLIGLGYHWKFVSQFAGGPAALDATRP
jgi:channel protein (hemolysin III family)